MGSSWSILPVSWTRSAARCGELRELALAPAAVVLDVDEHACPLAGLPRQHQVHEMLQGGQPLSLAPDERAQGIAIGLAGHDVQPAGLALAGSRR